MIDRIRKVLNESKYICEEKEYKKPMYFFRINLSDDIQSKFVEVTWNEKEENLIITPHGKNINIHNLMKEIDKRLKHKEIE